MQKTITNQIYIERTPEQVMDFLLRPENWLKFASGLVDAEPRNKGFAIAVILKHHRRSNTNILRMKILIYAFLFLLLGSCNQSPEKSLTQISEQTKQEAIATLKNLAKVRTAIPPTPKTYLNLLQTMKDLLWQVIMALKPVINHITTGEIMTQITPKD